MSWAVAARTRPQRTTTHPAEIPVPTEPACVGKPVPLRLIACGVSAALSEMRIDPDRAPTSVGLKVAVIVQLLPMPKVLGEIGQLLDEEKSPLGVIEVIANTALPVF